MGLYNKFKQRNALKEKIGKELMPVACIQQDFGWIWWDWEEDKKEIDPIFTDKLKSVQSYRNAFNRRN